jgi:hypothetical protein
LAANLNLLLASTKYPHVCPIFRRAAANVGHPISSKTVLMNLDSIKAGAWNVLVWAGIVGCLFLLIRGCQWVKERKSEINQLKADKEFTEFCSVNDATPAFKGLPNAGLLLIDLQRSLFVNEKRVAFRAKMSNLWRSKKYGTMMAVFAVKYGGQDVDAYLKCTESQAQELHDEYRRDKSATFLLVAEFERAEAYKSDSGSNSEADSEETYYGIGTLVRAQVAKETEHERTLRATSDERE